jgi:hypothetical protein
LRLDQCKVCRVCNATMRMKGGNIRVNGFGSRNCAHQWGPMQGQFEFQELAGHEHNLAAFLAAKQLWEWEHAEWLAQL